MIPLDELLRLVVNEIDQLAQSQALPYIEETVSEVIWHGDVDGTNYYIVRCGETPNPRITLSCREKAIAKLVAQGLPNKCIGNQLDISPWTVATHLKRIFAKLGVTSRTAMITQLIHDNLLQD